MKPLLLLPLTALALLLPGCDQNLLTGDPVGAPSLTDGKPQLPNACLVDAIVCFHDLAPAHAEPAILELYYLDGAGKSYGHAMTAFWWPPRPSRYAVRYLYDRTNASTPLPSDIDATDPLAVARFAIPSAYSAHWCAAP